MPRPLPPVRKVVRRKRPRDKDRPEEPKARVPYKRPAPGRLPEEDE